MRGGVGCASPLLLQLQACIEPAVDSQLLHHHNKQRPHRGQPAEQSQAVWDTGRQCCPPPPKKKEEGKKKLKSSVDQFLHCRYGNRAVSIGLGMRSV